MFIPSLHYFFITSTAMVVLYSDNILISSLVGLSSVAIYSIGYKLVDMTQKILFKIVDILIPDISKLYSNGEYQTILRLHNKILLLSAVAAFVGYYILFCWGVDIIRLWVGKEFTIDQNIFNIFLLFGLWHTWVHVSAIFIIAMGIHKETSYMGMIDAVLNILLSIVFFQSYGLYGIALGTLVAHLLTNGWFTNYWFYKNIKLLIEKEKDIN
jgi:O-antigen/teichoic acid export membrane protein